MTKDLPFDLAYALRLPPRDAVAWFRSKGIAVTDSWHQLWQDAHARAFTVAAITKLDLLEDVRAALDRSLAEGKTEAWFRKTLTPILQDKGWWGAREETAADGATIRVAQGSPSRLALIYRQNVFAAQNSGRYRAQTANAQARPWWQYVAIQDQATRPVHAALHGVVKHCDDPFWDSHYPPNGWGCRCKVRALSQRRLEAEGLTPDDGRLHRKDVDVIDRRTGEVIRRTVVGYQPQGNANVVWTGTGFSYNPGASAFGLDRELARKITLVRDERLYAEVVQALNNAPARHAAFAAQVERMLTPNAWGYRDKGKQAAVLGFVDRATAEFVRAKGHEPARVLVLSDAALIHADRAVHHRDGIALSKKELTNLAAVFPRPERILWDNDHNNLTYVYPDPAGKAGTAMLIMADSPAQGKRARQADGLDAFVNAYKAPRTQINNPGRYEEINRAGAESNRPLR